MSETAERLKIEIANLPAEEREELAKFLWSTLENGQAENQEEVDAAWEAELMRRREEVLSGKSDAIPLDEALASLRAELK